MNEYASRAKPLTVPVPAPLRLPAPSCTRPPSAGLLSLPTLTLSQGLGGVSPSEEPDTLSPVFAQMVPSHCLATFPLNALSKKQTRRSPCWSAAATPCAARRTALATCRPPDSRHPIPGSPEHPARRLKGSGPQTQTTSLIIFMQMIR